MDGYGLPLRQYFDVFNLARGRSHGPRACRRGKCIGHRAEGAESIWHRVMLLELVEG